MAASERKSARDIDALLSEHCMEWKLGQGPHMQSDCQVLEDFRAWYPSTNPVHSKQLKDKLWADGWRLMVQALSNDRYVARFWRIRLKGEANNDNETSTVLEGEAYSEAEEMAVALAALAAVGKPVEYAG